MDQAIIIAGDGLKRVEADVSTARLEALFDLHHARLYRLARRMSGDPEEARDLVQQTFLRAARRVAAIPAGERGGEAWLVRILVNLCRDRRRRLRVRRQARWPALREPVRRDPESIAVARATVTRALGELTPRRRAVVVLHDLEDRDVREIARLLGISRVTTRWHLARAREDLRRFLAGPARPPRESKP